MTSLDGDTTATLPSSLPLVSADVGSTEVGSAAETQQSESLEGDASADEGVTAATTATAAAGLTGVVTGDANVFEYTVKPYRYHELAQQ